MGQLMGNAVYSLALATAQSSGPSGDYIYLFCPPGSIDDGVENMQKVTNTYGGNSYTNKSGKRKQYIRVTNAIIFKESGATVDTLTECINVLFKFYHDNHAAGDSPIYAFLYKESDSDYRAFRNAAGTDVDYLLGIIQQLSVRDMGQYAYVNLTFVEASA